jgi:large subunit ribosomal protein L32
MPNPKRRHSKSRSRKRRTHYKASAPTLTNCSNCGTAILMHRVCQDCGYYRGKQVIEKTIAA